MTDDLLGGRRWRVECGDVLEVLANEPDNSVHCVITSPPYWGLRDYGIPPTDWPDGWRGSLGLEPDIDSYVRHLVTVFREIRRVLRRDGVCFLNIGDVYAHSGACGGSSPDGPRKPRAQDRIAQKKSGGTLSEGLKPKDLCLIPARVALALQADGWWVRSRIIWAKGVSFCKTYSGSSMPESATDRPSTSYEDVYLLTKAKSYYYDNEAVKEKSITNDPRKPYGSNGAWLLDGRDKWQEGAGKPQDRDASKRNLRSVWLINPHPFKEAHFATFPPALVEPMIKAGTSEKGVCPECGAPWRRVVEKRVPPREMLTERHAPTDGLIRSGQRQGGVMYGSGQKMQDWLDAHPKCTIGWEPTCECGLPEEDCVPAIILDPFSGSGTTIMVALRLGRRGIGIDISEDYCAMARKRVIEDCPMWNTP